MLVIKESKGQKAVISDASHIDTRGFERYVKGRGACKCKNTVGKGKPIFSSFITFADDSEYGLKSHCKDEAQVVKGGKFTTDVVNGFLVVVPKQKADGDTTID